jgi:hypothetical protein
MLPLCQGQDLLFIQREARLTNWRAVAEASQGEEIDDLVWETLDSNGDVEDLQLGLTTVAQLAAKARQLAIVLSRPAGRPTRDEPGKAELPQASEATRARIDALSAIYAAWAGSEPEVQRFRDRVLIGNCAMMGMAPASVAGLLAGDQVDRWVRWCFQADADGGDPQEHVLTLVARRPPNSRRPIADLWWIADGRELGQGVDVRGPLGQLAKLADTLTERYRWRPSESTMFVLTGTTPEVRVYVGSAEIRPSDYMAAGTRVTMTLDPALSLDEVAGIYDRLRRRFHEGSPPRYQAVRRYRLAEHVGPHVQMHTGTPDSRIGPGRRPRSGPAGLVFFIDPVDPHTWENLRVSWNRLYGNEPGWGYTRKNISNFSRDAQTALTRLLFPGWTAPLAPTAPAPTVFR